MQKKTDQTPSRIDLRADKQGSRPQGRNQLGPEKSSNGTPSSPTIQLGPQNRDNPNPGPVAPPPTTILKQTRTKLSRNVKREAF